VDRNGSRNERLSIAMPVLRLVFCHSLLIGSEWLAGVIYISIVDGVCAMQHGGSCGYVGNNGLSKDCRVLRKGILM